MSRSNYLAKLAPLYGREGCLCVFPWYTYNVRGRLLLLLCFFLSNIKFSQGSLPDNPDPYDPKTAWRLLPHVALKAERMYPPASEKLRPQRMKSPPTFLLQLSRVELELLGASPQLLSAFDQGDAGEFMRVLSPHLTIAEHALGKRDLVYSAELE
jgi:hypothetical protein